MQKTELARTIILGLLQQGYVEFGNQGFIYRVKDPVDGQILSISYNNATIDDYVIVREIIPIKPLNP